MFNKPNSLSSIMSPYAYMMAGVDAAACADANAKEQDTGEGKLAKHKLLNGKALFHWARDVAASAGYFNPIWRKNGFIIAASTVAIITTTSPAITQEDSSDIVLDQLKERVATLEATVAALSQNTENSDTEAAGVVAKQENTIPADREWYICGAAGRRWRTGHPQC